MPMRAARRTGTTTARAAFARGSFTATARARGELGKLFGQLCRSAMRTRCAFPVIRAHQDFAVPDTMFAMKFVNRHEEKIVCIRKNSSRTATAVSARCILGRARCSQRAAAGQGQPALPCLTPFRHAPAPNNYGGFSQPAAIASKRVHPMTARQQLPTN